MHANFTAQLVWPASSKQNAKLKPPSPSITGQIVRALERAKLTFVYALRERFIMTVFGDRRASGGCVLCVRYGVAASSVW